MDTPRILLQLELDPKSTPFAGAIEAIDGERQPFVGWLGLAEVIERVLAEARGGEGIRGAAVTQPLPQTKEASDDD